MSFAPLHPETSGLGEAIITLAARLATRTTWCPCCTQSSSRLCRYARRTLWDLPIRGRRVQRSLQVRRFRCGTPTCPRHTFREQVPALAPPRVHRTSRLLDTLCQGAFAPGGEAGGD